VVVEGRAIIDGETVEHMHRYLIPSMMLQ